MTEPHKAAGRVASVMQESRVFPPSTEFSSRARIVSGWPHRAVRFCRRYLAATRANLQP